MNPFPMVWADIRALRWTALAIVTLVALAVAIGVAIGAQERALRRSSAAAAEDFDLLIGAPGSQTQLVMSSIYLQPDAIPLIDGRLLNTLAKDERVAAVAPIAFGDISRGYVIVGTTADLVSRWGRLKPSEGRFFAGEGEAVLGADVSYKLGETIEPSHGVLGHAAKPGQVDEEEAGHRHEGHGYVAVGRLPRLGSPWDRAILVPVENVWEVHGLGNGHASEEAGIGLPFDGQKIPGVPAIVVKPRSVAGAYQLRAQYRQGGTMAFFPAEVLVTLYRALGDVRDVLVVASVLNAVLILAAVLLLLVAVAGLRRRRYAVLRALGAPRAYVLLVVWLGMALLIGAGCLSGLAVGAVFTRAVSGLVEAQTGLRLAFSLESREMLQVLLLFAIGSVVSLLPALMSYRAPVVAGLRE
ncbi:ABC transporter permease [Bosea sp. BK604]|uniref:FtsX-like permease family protein n=1 Tax=Bosea sp. BK604 TaxID=2512180 RepID=UPI001051B68B|nr:ABC transporter permease [Bosea sp. BK604]TCR67241.1 putative ABC transport system permease protein [Bosea sp. BK604]